MPTVRSGDATIAYEVAGDGEPVLLIMGLGAERRAWALQLPGFTERHRVIAFDNRGVGESSTPPGPYSTEQMAADALAVMDAAGVARAHVVGVSLGGTIAQQVALLAPDRVGALVLASTWCGPSEWRTRVRAMQLAILDALGLEALTRARMLLVFTPPLFENEKLMDAIEATMNATTSPEGYVAQYVAAEAHDLRDRLGGIAAPTLVLTGARDVLVPRELTEECARLIPGAELAVLDTAHSIQFETAEEFNARVLDFLARHPLGD